MNVFGAIAIGLLFCVHKWIFKVVIFILLSGFIRMESMCLKVRRNFLVAIDTYLHKSHYATGVFEGKIESPYLDVHRSTVGANLVNLSTIVINRTFRCHFCLAQFMVDQFWKLQPHIKNCFNVVFQNMHTDRGPGYFTPILFVLYYPNNNEIHIIEQQQKLLLLLSACW